MKKCPFCGADIEESARFCLYCMQSLTEKEQIFPRRKKKPQWWLTVVAIAITPLILAAAWFGIQIALGNGTPSDTSSVGGSVHTPAAAVKEKYIDSSCTETGSYDEVVYCSVCEEELSRTQKTVDKKPHNYNQKVTTTKYLKTEATETSPAMYYYSCACGAKGTNTFTSGGVLGHTHNFNQKDTSAAYRKSPATCTELAVYYYSCVCGEKGSTTFTSGTVLPHTFDQRNTDSSYQKSPATCTKAAVYYYSCSCGAKGSTTFTSGAVLPHTFGDWIVDTVATCVEIGKRHHVCAVCQESVSETYSDPNYHNYDTAWTVDGTHHWHECLNCGGMSGKTAHSITNGFCTDCGVRNVDNTTYTRDGNYIYFGEYPQSLKADDVTITANMDVRGYYIGSDGCYYAKVYADPRYDTYKFQSGALVEGLCYFKVEPIRWRILSEDGDTALILCDSVIANKEFDENNGNLYSRSSIRNWLNDRFYNTVFNEIQRRLIDVILIDDRADAGAINDRVFLLSYGDVTNADYGFDPSVRTCDTSRCMTVSDYARATGADMSTSAGCYGNGTWWLRTHYSSEYERYAPVVSGEGCADGYGIIRNEAGGVVPALKIRLNDGVYRLDDATVLVYKVNEDGTTCTITGIGTCDETEVVIPAEIDGMKVTSIGDYASDDCDNIKSITITDGVTSIGGWAFHGCTSLENINIPDSVTSIGDYAFSGCASLENINIPDSLTSIGDYAFSGCASLENINIPDSVTSIGGSAFYGCTSLESINISNGITSIGDYAFSDCTGLTSVTIGNSVTSIGDWAFRGCDNLKSVYITDIVAWLNISFGIESSNPCYDAVLYLNGELLTNLVIPDNVTKIRSYAFYGCKSLNSIVIPGSVTNIEYGAFFCCDNIKSITISDGITSIEYSAFHFLENLESVTIGNSVTSIGDSAFYGCEILTRINYRGTISQWNDIYKAPHWNDYTGSYTVYCTDGKITKDGTVTYY